MDLKSVDLNLLLTFDALFEHASVTRAGESLGLSQPAMSASLARLRRLFDDPLFVKSGARMEPTDRAQALSAPVRRVIDTIRTEILLPTTFDPASSERAFTLMTPDLGEIQFVPPLLARLERAAPGVRLSAVSRPRETAAEELANGEVDLAVGYFPDLRAAAVFRQKLFDTHHVCLVRQDHPAARAGTLSREDYLAARHVVVRPEGREHVFEQHLQAQAMRIHVALEVSHFLSLLPIIANSDLVATVPLDLARICERYTAVCIVEAPLESPSIPIHQFWHRRAHKDAGNAWLRAVVHELFSASRK